MKTSSYNTRNLVVRYLLSLCILVISLSSLASADLVQDLTVTLYYPNCLIPNGACGVDSGSAGSPASGRADFHDIGADWSYTFLTGTTLDWGFIGPDYFANFDSGTFDMDGPYGLHFGGNIDSARVDSSISGTTAHVNFSGYWNNGIYGYGVADVEIRLGNKYADLVTNAVAPEPSSLFMLGSGVLGLGGLLRRRFLG